MHPPASAEATADSAREGALPGTPEGRGIRGSFLGELLAAYTRVVHASGGFPDVKISTLRAALSLENAACFDERLRALWSEGRVTLSFGDWSLASEEMRAAAIELDGERYLLVRFETAPDEPLPS